MFKGLRLRLTLLYMVAALSLIFLICGGSLVLVSRYFENITDLALQHKMTHEFHALAAPLPSSLALADRDWSTLRSEVNLIGQTRRPVINIAPTEAALAASMAYKDRQVVDVHLSDEYNLLSYEVRFDDGSEVYVDAANGQVIRIERNLEQHAEQEKELPDTEGAYDSELASIFVLPLDRSGTLLIDLNPYASPFAPDKGALAAALQHGSDLRTITLADNSRVRLLTYRLTRDDGPAALQLGRILSDQDEVINQLILGLLLLGSIATVLLGVGSWWLSGRALRPAQLAWERQQGFIASASHELRAPLTLIRASAEMALRGSTTDDQRELLGDVLSESDHMRQMVDDLLTLSRLDSGRLELRSGPVDLHEMLHDVQRRVSRVSEQHGVKIAIAQAEGIAHADPDRLRQVLLILLDNALCYTPDGGQITLDAHLQRREVVLRVADTGCGIAPEHLPRIFERFYRADPARSRNEGNVGLGLSIAKGLVEAMGGRINAHSTLGAGTVIQLKLPIAS